MNETPFSISQDDAAYLVAAAVSLFKEADLCADAGAWRAAAVLVAAAVEAGILATAARLEPELRTQGVWPLKSSPAETSFASEPLEVGCRLRLARHTTTSLAR